MLVGVGRGEGGRERGRWKRTKLTGGIGREEGKTYLSKKPITVPCPKSAFAVTTSPLNSCLAWSATAGWWWCVSGTSSHRGDEAGCEKTGFRERGSYVCLVSSAVPFEDEGEVWTIDRRPGTVANSYGRGWR